MKKIACLVLSLLLAFGAAGCTGEDVPSSQTETSSQAETSSQVEVSSQAEPSSEESGGPGEPTNVYQDLSFLNEEQQELFARGEQVSFLFSKAPSDIGGGEFRDPTISDAEGDELSRKDREDEIEWGKYGWPYGPVSTSLYRNWDDFEKMILEIYTEECFWELNGMNAVEDVRDINAITDLNNLNRECKKRVSFLNVNGRLYTSKGYNVGTHEWVEEEYELMEQTEDRVFFYRVCTYQEMYPYVKDGRILRCSYPVELLCTPDGWRIQQFSDGRLFDPYLLWKDK